MFADIHRAYQTSIVKQLLHKNKTVLINIPGGVTSTVQPLDDYSIEDYTMPSGERKFTHLEDDEESGSRSEFTEVDTDFSNDLTESASELESD